MLDYKTSVSKNSPQRTRLLTERTVTEIDIFYAKFSLKSIWICGFPISQNVKEPRGIDIISFTK